MRHLTLYSSLGNLKPVIGESDLIQENPITTETCIKPQTTVESQAGSLEIEAVKIDTPRTFVLLL